MTRPIHVSIPFAAGRSRNGIVIHRRTELNVTRRDGIPVTTPIDTLFDIAVGASERTIEADINEAAKLGLVTPRQLHRAANAAGKRKGAAAIRRILDRQTFVLTDSELERLFLPITRRAGLPPPQTRTYVNGFKVDFVWPHLMLVVETDGGSYHSTPAQQTADRRRDQAHAAAGFVALRFTHGQVKFDRPHVDAVLAAVVKRLKARPAAPAPPARSGRDPRPAHAARLRPPHRCGGP
jgi:very-short-patch-repair endonuclease